MREWEMKSYNIREDYFSSLGRYTSYVCDMEHGRTVVGHEKVATRVVVVVVVVVMYYHRAVSSEAAEASKRFVRPFVRWYGKGKNMNVEVVITTVRGSPKPAGKGWQGRRRSVV